MCERSPSSSCHPDEPGGSAFARLRLRLRLRGAGAGRVASGAPASLQPLSDIPMPQVPRVRAVQWGRAGAALGATGCIMFGNSRARKLSPHGQGERAGRGSPGGSCVPARDPRRPEEQSGCHVPAGDKRGSRPQAGGSAAFISYLSILFFESL